MGFLRRLLRGSEGGDHARPAVEAADAATVEADERARDLDLLREDQERLDDLARRQLRYAEYAWEPPAQGGERRADDEEARSERGDAS